MRERQRQGEDAGAGRLQTVRLHLEHGRLQGEREDKHRIKWTAKYTNPAQSQACVLLEGLNKGLPRLGVGKSAKSIAAFKALQQSSSASPQNREVPQAKVTIDF